MEASNCMVGDGGVLTTGADVPSGPKALVASLPRGAYTACRTVGGSKGMRILKLDYHLDRLCSSLRILFPQHSFDDLPLPQQVGLEARVGGGHFVVDAPAKDALLILFGGESRGGQCAAEELALQLTQKVPGAVVKSMAGQSPDILTRHVGACAIILECDAEGQAVFPASNFIRSLKAMDSASLKLKGLGFSVLGIAFSTCDFSAASLGDDKFRAARVLDKKLANLGAHCIVQCMTSDIEVDDIQASVAPWMSNVCSEIGEIRRNDKEFDRRIKEIASARMSAALQEISMQVEGDAMVTVVVSPSTDGGGNLSGVSVNVLASPLHEALQPTVVEVAGGPRKLPMAKDTAWIQERAPLEQAKGQDATEVILQDDAGVCLLEGLITNFFVIDSEGVLLTAGDRVLEGHVRSLVLSVARASGIAVRLQAPDMMQASTWKGAFLTSATRIVQPIKTIRFPAAGGAQQKARERTFDSFEEVLLLREQVMLRLHSD